MSLTLSIVGWDTLGVIVARAWPVRRLSVTHSEQHSVAVHGTLHDGRRNFFVYAPSLPPHRRGQTVRRDGGI